MSPMGDAKAHGATFLFVVNTSLIFLAFFFFKGRREGRYQIHFGKFKKSTSLEDEDLYKIITDIFDGGLS